MISMVNGNKRFNETLKIVMFLGSTFVFFSLLMPHLIPHHWILPDLGLILTIYCALFLSPGAGMFLSLFAGAYMGGFSSSPLEYMVFYGLIFEGIRFASSYIQMKTLRYSLLLSFFLELVLGGIFATEIYLAQEGIYPLVELVNIVLYQSLLTALVACPVFWVFNLITFRRFILSDRIDR